MNNKINVLVIGSGGREDSISQKLRQSPQAGTIYVAPGNPGTAMAGCQNIPILPTPENFKILALIAENLNIGLAVIGPDNALADGIVAAFNYYRIPTFGPENAIIESSKAFAKNFMVDAGIPTAPFRMFDNPEEAKDYAVIKDGYVVVKADGLALGKGARVCKDVESAKQAIDDFMIRKIHKKAGDIVIMEDLLEGQELSVHALCDGKNVKMFPFLRDHKQLLDGNEGPMTGGMGVCGPISIDAGLAKTIEDEIVLPCIQELERRGMPFIGCLYPGLMLTSDGPMVLEFNARFGDPETQAYMLLLEDDVDIIEVFLACIHGSLDKIDLRWKNKSCMCITLAAHGYPDNPRKGDLIRIDQIENTGYATPKVFHCGTKWENGRLVTNGGRVLSIAKLSNPHNHNSTRSTYDIIQDGEVSFVGMQYRKDIGKVW